MDVVVAVVICLVLLGVIGFLIGAAVIIGASDELSREFDDRDQEEFLRRWAEEKKAKDARKQARHRKR
jgi:hypothetical protein